MKSTRKIESRYNVSTRILDKNLTDSRLVDDSESEFFEAYHEFRKEKEVVKKETIQYKLLEEIANGIKFFGQVKKTKDLDLTCIAICHCGEAWRVRISHVRNGRIKSCGCSKRSKK